MNRFDRYMLSQLMMLFGFFALVLVSVYWVNRAVVLFDRLIADGQPISTFVEFTVLSLPAVVKLVLPIASFAAATYVTNRLMNESEMVVMQATGFSPWRLARPVLTFGLVTGVLMAALSLFLVPLSKTQLEQREREIAENATARLLTEGTFLEPARGIVLYIRDINADGALSDVHLSDRSSADVSVTYTAKEAYLIKDDSGPKLIMVDGLAQFVSQPDNRLFTTNFADFTYDIGSLLTQGSSGKRRLERASSLDLLAKPKDVAELLNLPVGWAVAELHSRISQIFMCIIAALVGFSTLLLGSFNRLGAWPKIVAAFLILILLEALKSGVAAPVRAGTSSWPLMYAPSLFGISIIVGMLFIKTRIRRLPGRSTA